MSAFKWRVLVYFAAIGLAFLFVEIAFIQKFILVLHHPLYAAAVVLSSFLVFAGLGSAWSRWHGGGVGARSGVVRAAVGIAVASFALLALEPFLHFLAPWSAAVKVPIAVALVAPLAFCMGMPFPLGLRHLTEHAPELVPWAWGVNGCASVLSAVLATLLAIHFGFTLVVLAALVLYAVAAAAFPGASRVLPP